MKREGSNQVEFSLCVNTGNEAVQTIKQLMQLVENVVRAIPAAWQLHSGLDEDKRVASVTRKIRDMNGNTVGSWSLTIKRE